MYLDLLLLLNMAVNYFLLRLTAFILRQKVHSSRLLFVSFAAALFPLLIYLMDKPPLHLWPARILLPLAMIYLSFRPQRWRQGICQYLIFYLCSLALGGLALVFSMGEKAAFGGGELYIIASPSPARLLFAATLLYAGVRLAEPLLLEKLYFHLPPATVEMEIGFCGKSKKLTAFIDTGNMLRCPFTGIPVAVAAYSSVRELLPGEVCAFLEDNRGMDWFRLETVLCGKEYAAKFCIVPYHSLQEKGFLLAFRPEKLKLREEGSQAAVETQLLVAVQYARDSADYEVLLPLEAWRSAAAEKNERNITYNYNAEDIIFMDNKN